MIAIEEHIDAVRKSLDLARGGGKVVGLVPTMGALHAGHAKLIEEARKATDFVVVSIFVNPTQFGPGEDFDRYPRTPEADRECCANAGADLIFAPSPETMYPRSRDRSTYVEVPAIGSILEGAVRPGHFRGVATVVLKLMTITRPDVAFFGAKDYQQLQVIRLMVEDLNLPTAVRAVPTVREADGLAMSSRNRYLRPEERNAAAVLHRALENARVMVAAGERDADRVRRELTRTIESERLARLDYVEVADVRSLEPLARIEPGSPAVGLLAVRFGATRLIDNAVLTG